MKLTIEIDDKHAGDLLQFLASISAKRVGPETESPTMQEVGIPKEYYPLPDLPKGKSRWVGRGRFGGKFASGNGREIYYYSGDKQWRDCIDFSYHVFHIEAV
jgi:hypothetical protein